MYMYIIVLIRLNCFLLLFQANEQSKRFEGILNICNKQVNPKMDIHNMLLTLSEKLSYSAKKYSFKPPSDPNIPGSEVFIMHYTVSVIYLVLLCQGGG